ncbi:hypothetical protein MMC25_006266 [Agyrium rufum]|nr:hypothetical protein [Agyrium rufum]
MTISSTTSSSTTTVPSELLGSIDLPSVAQRVLSIYFAYNNAAGKERDAAVSLMTRLVLRPDMRKQGLMEIMITDALQVLRSEDHSRSSAFEYIGMLSLIAGISSNLDVWMAIKFIPDIFRCIQSIVTGDIDSTDIINNSALARKLCIKVVRIVTISALQLPNANDAKSQVLDDMLEPAVGILLDALSDKDTQVRMAASKSLGLVALKLPSDLASQIIQSVVDDFEDGVFWEKSILDQLVHNAIDQSPQERPLRSRNLNAVNSLRWHGLTLSLGHFLFRRSPPPDMLPEVLSVLIMALSFEQRSATGASIGSNVRDAACYGIWSLARRYTTKELLAVDTSKIRVLAGSGKGLSIVQVLADELVVTACTDTAGNIRRGASAALQEMVGRHPDCIQNGIALVQTVDYHAVALRSRSLDEVVPDAANIDRIYWEALFDGLLGWRGIASPEAASRRLAANALGRLAICQDEEFLPVSVTQIRQRIVRIGVRSIEQRHGCLLALVAILENIAIGRKETASSTIPSQLRTLWEMLQSDHLFSDQDFTQASLQPHLTAEAVCCLISSMVRLTRNEVISDITPGTAIIENCMKMITLSMTQNEENIIECAASAARALCGFILTESAIALAQSFLERALTKRSVTGSTPRHPAYFAGLGAVFPALPPESNHPIRGKIIDFLVDPILSGSVVEAKTASLKALKEIVHPRSQCEKFDPSVFECLKIALRDYTTDQRGDIGSLVRLEAIDVVRIVTSYSLASEDEVKVLLAGVAILAGEKLDKVRGGAWQALCDILQHRLHTEQSTGAHTLLLSHHEYCLRSVFKVDTKDVSSRSYFHALLSLATLPWLRESILTGIITSAGAGSENIVIASRDALTYFLEQDPDRGAGFVLILQDVLLFGDERLITPAFEVLAFILDTRILSTISLEQSHTSWKKLLFAVKKAHFKSTNLPKLKAAVDTYSGLCSIETVRNDVIEKLKTMLVHPYPMVRNLVADTLFAVTQEKAFLCVDWSRSSKDLKVLADLIPVTT